MARKTVLYEVASPQWHSPKWNTSRHYNSKTRTIIIPGIVMAIFITLVLLNPYSADMHEYDIPIAQFVSTPKLANETLDFGKIYVLNLESRDDRHDDMALIAAATGLQLSFVAGVNSENLDKQALPDIYGTSYYSLKPAHLACYRGHANIWRKIIEDGVDTALIM